MSIESTKSPRPPILPRQLVHFCLLDREQQANAIRSMSAQGWSDYRIAAATRLSVEQIRRVLAE
jgi:hypothetical protein